MNLIVDQEVKTLKPGRTGLSLIAAFKTHSGSSAVPRSTTTDAHVLVQCMHSRVNPAFRLSGLMPLAVTNDVRYRSSL
jgi:hypothetical protein